MQVLCLRLSYLPHDWIVIVVINLFGYMKVTSRDLYTLKYLIFDLSMLRMYIDGKRFMECRFYWLVLD